MFWNGSTAIDGLSGSAGYESTSGFRDAFARVFGAPPRGATTRP